MYANKLGQRGSPHICQSEPFSHLHLTACLRTHLPPTTNNRASITQLTLVTCPLQKTGEKAGKQGGEAKQILDLQRKMVCDMHALPWKNHLLEAV
jgi:hypothetical protein